jgi:histone H3/H4
MKLGNVHPEFSPAAMKRILEREGAERVSEEAKIQLLATINFLAKEIAHHAVRIARDTGKSTVTAENVRDATKWVLEQGVTSYG